MSLFPYMETALFRRERGRDGVELAGQVGATVVTAVMITTEMRPAMRPYSMAVAPEQSLRNRETNRDMKPLLLFAAINASEGRHRSRSGIEFLGPGERNSRTGSMPFCGLRLLFKRAKS
jgi:hypothetical protein